MNKISQIREMLQYLPEKDIELANKLLDKRQFVELKELIDSDVYKVAKLRSSAERLLSTEDFEPTKEDLESASMYETLKDLQYEVSVQAAAFESELTDEEFYSPEDYD